MSVVFKYKNFIGSIEVSTQDKCLYGSVLYVNDLVTYEAKTVDALEKEFKKAVDDYLKTCKKLGREPLKSFNGTLNVRIGSALHKEAAEYAALHDMSINECIKNALQNQIGQHKTKMTSAQMRRAVEELLSLKHYLDESFDECCEQMVRSKQKVNYDEAKLKKTYDKITKMCRDFVGDYKC
ncbi:MAG: type II toxin-antitoxin system HicB family antitoxin [Gammaproteobacteria bacterium]|jgi:predicted HicB family RNase H-like nuclease